MKQLKAILTLILVLPFISVGAQDSLSFSGMVSGWMHVNPEIDLPVNAGLRYIPAFDYQVKLKKDRMIDFEASANINGSLGFSPFDTIHSYGKIKPYRVWARFSADQYELRLGLQKINFGSASMLRPLMWFDQLDPRDPLQLTDGVWSLLFRYYFLNNANLWLWGLYGNEGPKTWETGKSAELPEYGGRFQSPVPKGEVALSFHHRIADTRGLTGDFQQYGRVGENRIGIDGKWDVGVGLWFEGTWIGKTRYSGFYTNQELFTAGIDYTFGLGNGLNVIAEHLVFALDENAFQFRKNTSFTGISLSYPLVMNDNLSGIVFYDWTHGNFYNFLNLKHDFGKMTGYLMAFMNPAQYIMPQQGESSQLFAGKGFQIMIVYNY
ncbi:MAG TPA: hypothetical protein VK179_00805 [Bacteroidales bacterium]|nr:hypothetical protein [Bacteroidales bacterium]